MAKLEMLPQTSDQDDFALVPTVPSAVVDLSGLTAVADPWRWRSVVGICLCNAVAVAVILLGWFEASASAMVRRQLPWLNVGMCGLAVAAIGNSLWLRERRRALVGLVASGTELWDWIARSTGAPEEPDEIRLDGRTDDGVFVSAARAQLFHRPDCPFVAGKSVTRQLRSSHEAAGRSACAVCEP